MAALPDPRELLELNDGQSATFRVLAWERGEATIFPRHQPDGKDVPHLRLHVPPTDKAHFPYYWDIHSKTLVAQLTPQLERADASRLVFVVTARGVGEKKRFTVETRPA